MSGTSQKHRNFVAEPMGDKPVTDLAGVGDVLGGRLKNAGFDRGEVYGFVCTPAIKQAVLDSDHFESEGKQRNQLSRNEAYVVLGQFLVLKKNKELFQEWMKDVCSASSKQSSDCWQCLNDWCEEFL